VYWFDVPKSYQAIKRLPFGCSRIFGPFLYAPAAHDVTQNCKLFGVDSGTRLFVWGFCHIGRGVLEGELGPRTERYETGSTRRKDSSTNRALASDRTIKISGSIATTFGSEQLNSDACRVDLSLPKTVTDSTPFVLPRPQPPTKGIGFSEISRFAAEMREELTVLIINKRSIR